MICPCSQIPIVFPRSVQYTPDRRSIRKIPAYSWFLTISHLRVDGQVCIAHYLSSTPRVQAEAWEIIKRRFAAPPHGSFTPAAVLTEPPPLLETVAGREYHCHSDCHRHTGGNPILAEGVLARPGKPGGHGVPCCCGSRFRASELMYLMNGYLVFKVH